MARIRKINVSQVEGNDNGVLPAGTIVAYEVNGEYVLRVHNGVTEGGVSLNAGQTPVIFNGTDGIVVGNLNEGIAALFNNGDVYITGGESLRFTGLDNIEGESSAVLRFWNGEGRHSLDNDTTELVTLNVGNDADSGDPTLGFFKIITEKQVGGEKEWKFDADGVLTLPEGGDILDSEGNSVLGNNENQNVWVQTFETQEGAPDDIPILANSVEYDSEGNVIALFVHSAAGGSYYSVGKFTSTGVKIWTARFADSFDTDGWGLAVDNDSNSIYVAGKSEAEGGQNNATLTKIDGSDGSVVWSKVYDFGFDSDSPVVDVAADGNPVMVGYASNGADDYVTTTKISGVDGSITWTRSLDGQGDEKAYGMAVGPTGEVVSIGWMDQLNTILESYPVTPQTGSGVNILVINRSDLSNDTFTTSWQVAGTGITGTIGVNAINIYTDLTSTVREGTGATFTIDDNGSGLYFVGVDNGGSNYLVGHKIKVLGSALGGVDGVNDCVITVTIVDAGAITNVSSGGTAAGSTSTSYNGVTGTNYNVGSGLEFSLELDSGETYTEHPFNITAGGTNYVDGDVVVIPGTQLGGTTPANDLTATVSTADGAVTQFNTFSGTQQTTTYRVRTEDNGIDFGGTGTWTLNDVSTDDDDRMLVVKYDSTGTIAWQKAILFDTGFDCYGADADIDSDGNIYVTGNYIYYDSDNDTNTSALSILKLDSTGAKQWSRRVVGNCETFGTSVVVGPDDKLYLSGVTGNNNNSDYTWVAAKYGFDGAVEWQRLIDNTDTWSFGGFFFFESGSGSNIAVKQDYVVLGGGFGFLPSDPPNAAVVQVSATGDIFSVGDWDFKAATFSGLLNDTASDITVVNAGKTDTDNSENITTTTAELDTEVSGFLIGTLYRASGGDGLITITGDQVGEILTIAQDANNQTPGLDNALSIDYIPTSLLNANDWIGTGGNDQNTYATVTFANGTTNLISGWNTDSFGDSGFLSLDTAVTLTGEQVWPIVITSYNYNAGTTPGKGISVEGNVWKFDNVGDLTLPDGGTITEGVVTDNPTIELTPASPEVASQKLVIKGGMFEEPADYHLHLTTGDLNETSIILGTDEHNVRTTIEGKIQITTPGENSNVWEFDTTGNLTLPAGGDILDSTGVNQTAQRAEGSWTLPDNTTAIYSFTVPMDGTYVMWVKANIPNGIIVWNATVSVSNSNVPAIGTQYAWNYTGGGTPIELIDIPNQIRGTAGTISTDATYAGTTSNRFDFNISNGSGASQTVYYGYTKI